MNYFYCDTISNTVLAFEHQYINTKKNILIVLKHIINRSDGNETQQFKL